MRGTRSCLDEALVLSFNTKDNIMSHRHVVFELAKSGESQTKSKYSKVLFEVVGKNPMCFFLCFLLALLLFCCVWLLRKCRKGK